MSRVSRAQRPSATRASTRRATPAAAVSALVGVVLVLAGCAPAASTPPASSPSDAGDGAALHGRLSVYAAASLRTAFDRLTAEFARAHPGVEVAPVVYDGSSVLATQIVEGAPADVFASADERTMATVVDAGATGGDPVLFASNTLVIVVPAGNPAGVTGLDSLADAAVSVVTCAPEVPCGNATQRLFTAAGVSVTPVSVEQSVAAVLAKVAAGEADAGLVYRTDAVASPDVESIAADGADRVVNRYPIAALHDAESPEIAQAFVALVTGPEGRAALTDLGFGAP